MKIAFIGTHGVGKTTLCFDVAARLKRLDVTVELVREIARLCPLPINQRTTIPAQSWILHTQIAEEIEAASKGEAVLCDRSVIDNYCYLRQAGHEPAIEALVRWWGGSYDFLFRVPILAAPRADGKRDPDESFQRLIDEQVGELLAEWQVPHRLLPMELRESWPDLVLDLVLPGLRPQEPLFPELDG